MITREEALLLLAGMCKAPVRCRVRTSLFSFWIEGRLSLTEDVISVNSSTALLELRVSEDMAFEYAESKDLLEGETKGGILAGVAIALPLRLPLPLPEVPPQRDKAIFFELVE